MSDRTPAVACTPSAIPAADRQRWVRLTKAVYAAVQEVRELPDGYELRLPSDADTLVRTAEYMSLDRLCCKFLQFEIRIEPGGEPVWLRLIGSEAGKQVLRTSFESIDLLDERVAAAAGFSVTDRTPAEDAAAHC
jgi:hypothetical protein